LIMTSSHLDSSVLGEQDPFKSRDKLIHSNDAHEVIRAFQHRDKLVHSNNAIESFQSRDKLIHSNSDIDPERLQSHAHLTVQVSGEGFRSNASNQPQSPTTSTSPSEMLRQRSEMRQQQHEQHQASTTHVPEFLSRAATTVTHVVNAIGLAVEEEAARLKSQYHAYRAHDEKMHLGDRVSLSSRSQDELMLASELHRLKHEEMIAAGLQRGPDIKTNAP